MSAAGAKRRTADPSGAGGGSGGATSRKGGSSGNDKYYSQQKSHEDLEEELQTAIRRLDDVKAYQDDEFIAELEALSRARDEKLTALAPLYKGDKPGHATDRSSAGITKTTTARTSVENQRRAISDEYEAARAKVCDRITTNLENVQKTARAEIEALVEQGGQQGRVRRKTRARGEAGGFLADREKAINVAHRLQEIVAKVCARLLCMCVCVCLPACVRACTHARKSVRTNELLPSRAGALLSVRLRTVACGHCGCCQGKCRHHHRCTPYFGILCQSQNAGLDAAFLRQHQ